MPRSTDQTSERASERVVHKSTRMSVASDGSVNADQAEAESPDLLVAGVQSKLGRPGSEITAAAHASACRKLLRLRNLVRAGEALSPTAKMVLACTGVVLYRKAVVLMPASTTDDVDEATLAEGQEYSTTTMLIFIILSLATPQTSYSNYDLEQLVSRSERAALWGKLRDGASEPGGPGCPTPIWVNKALDGIDFTLDAASPVADDSQYWDVDGDDDMVHAAGPSSHRDPREPLPHDYCTAHACLALGSAQSLRPGDVGAAKRMEWLSKLFFCETAMQLTARQLKRENDHDFLSLSAAAFSSAATSGTGSSDSQIFAVVAAAESEAGQSILRDLILSFLLPASVIGVRTTLLLARQAAHAATIDYAEEVQYAHEAAMAGAEYLMANSDDELRLTCVLLAGIACLTTREGADPIRKGNAFGGHVSLPFLETRPPASPAAPRITLLPESRTWILYRLNPTGQPCVLSSACDYAGLRLAVAAFVKAL